MIRAATVDDARGIATVHVRGWQASYRGIFPDDVLDKLSIDRRTADWTRWLAEPQQASAVYVTAAGVVGFVTVGSSRDAGAGPRTGEVLAIYVLADSHRRGIGTALMSWAVAEAAVHGWQQMTLWTLAANVGARAFYERCGWALDGASKREPFAGAVVDQVRFARRSASRPEG